MRNCGGRLRRRENKGQLQDMPKPHPPGLGVWLQFYCYVCLDGF